MPIQPSEGHSSPASLSQDWKMQWSSTIAEMHLWSTLPEQADQYVVELENKRNILWSDKHDSNSLEVLDITGRFGGIPLAARYLYNDKVMHGPHGDIWAREKKAFPNDDSVEGHLLREKQTAGSCRIV